MIIHNIKQSIRGMRKNKVYTFFNITFFTTLFITIFNINNALGQSITKELTINDFNKISVSNGIEVYLVFDDTKQVAITCEKDIIDNIQVSVKNETLIIGYKNLVCQQYNKNNHSNIQVTVHAKYIKSLKTASAGRITWEGTLVIDKLLLNCSYAGHMNGNINSNKIIANLSSAGSYKGEINTPKAIFNLSSAAEAKVTGSINTLVVNASSASTFRGIGIVYENFEGNTNSMAKTYLSTSKKNKK